jgi:hypothetical protein
MGPRQTLDVAPFSVFGNSYGFFWQSTLDSARDPPKSLAEAEAFVGGPCFGA